MDRMRLRSFAARSECSSARMRRPVFRRAIELGLVHGLDEVIVRARLEAGDDVLLGIACGQEQRIDVAVELQVAHRLAERRCRPFPAFPSR